MRHLRRAHTQGPIAAELDGVTAERLLSGRIEPGDAPAGYADVADLLLVARMAAEERPDETRAAATIARMVGANHAAIDAAAAARQRRAVRPVKVAASLAIAMSLTGGLAAADVLPGRTAQRVRNTLAATVDRAGLDVLLTPKAKERARTKDETPIDADKGDRRNDPNHGSVVSGVARSTPPGPGHGEAVSAAARSDAGKRAHGNERANEVRNENAQDAQRRSNGRGPACTTSTTTASRRSSTTTTDHDRSDNACKPTTTTRPTTTTTRDGTSTTREGNRNRR